MILTCPECSTRYQADEANFLPAGRTVRCAKCGHVWHQAPSEAVTEAEPLVVEPEPAAPPPEPEPRARAYVQTPSFSVGAREDAPKSRPLWPRRVLLGAGWVVLAAIVILIGWMAAIYRQQIVGAWPQSASLYSTLGLKTDASGFKFDNVKYRMQTEDGQPVLSVSGALVNVSDRALSVPQVRVALTDDDGHELYHWTFAPSVLTLSPGQSTRFVTRLSSPPSAARHLDLRLAKASE
ncbi:MAG: zinc-ribbon domain-containing protein [Alphaproteobacteria bacterium]|nr:zinc-ribbon domain-containing protein [Alphaproteobacteria bacterium]